MNEKEPLAHAKVEVIEASDMKASDLNGLFFSLFAGTLMFTHIIVCLKFYI